MIDLFQPHYSTKGSPSTHAAKNVFRRAADGQILFAGFPSQSKQRHAHFSSPSEGGRVASGQWLVGFPVSLVSQKGAGVQSSAEGNQADPALSHWTLDLAVRIGDSTPPPADTGSLEEETNLPGTLPEAMLVEGRVNDSEVPLAGWTGNLLTACLRLTLAGSGATWKD